MKTILINNYNQFINDNIDNFRGNQLPAAARGTKLSTMWTITSCLGVRGHSLSSYPLP